MSDEDAKDPVEASAAGEAVQDAPATGVGERIEHYRKAAGLTREQLAQRSGVALSQVNKLCTGKFEPRVETLRALARALGGISFNALLSPEGDSPAVSTGEYAPAIQRAVDAGRVAEASAKTLGLPETLIQLAEAQAVGRAAVPERSTGRRPGE